MSVCCSVCSFACVSFTKEFFKATSIFHQNSVFVSEKLLVDLLFLLDLLRNASSFDDCLLQRFRFTTHCPF